MNNPQKKIKPQSNLNNRDVFSVKTRLITRINKLLKAGYKEESIILIVTFFEVFFKISFKNFKDRWLSQFPNLSNEEKIEYRKTIRKYLESRKLYDEYLRNFHIHQDISSNPEIESLYDTLFGEPNKRKINFQNLNEAYGVRKAYQTFFNFDISKKLDPNQKKSNEMWELLKKMFEERHNIIHNGEETSLTSNQINDILDSIDFLIDELRFVFTDTVELEDLFESFRKGYLSSVEINSEDDFP